MKSLSTHVLDTSLGKPAVGVPVVLEFQEDSQTWSELSKGVTNHDGRISSLIPPGLGLNPGIYRITFDTAAYFQSKQVVGLFPYVSVVFEKKEGDPNHYHIPLLLSPYGYSTYRGS